MEQTVYVPQRIRSVEHAAGIPEGVVARVGNLKVYIRSDYGWYFPLVDDWLTHSQVIGAEALMPVQTLRVEPHDIIDPKFWAPPSTKCHMLVTGWIKDRQT